MSKLTRAPAPVLQVTDHPAAQHVCKGRSGRCVVCFGPLPAEKNTAAVTRLLPSAGSERKAFPMCTGLLDYFPDALAAVSEVSYLGNEKHNPGQRLHWARGKSMDHDDCIIRHTVERGGFEDVEISGKVRHIRHSAARAWRALAALQEELEAEGVAGPPRNATDVP